MDFKFYYNQLKMFKNILDERLAENDKKSYPDNEEERNAKDSFIFAVEDLLEGMKKELA